MWPIAFKTLIADRGKLATALVGVVFSIVLVNIQGGLFVGLIRKASLLVDQGLADVWVGHKQMHNVDFPKEIPRQWVHRIRGVPGVAAAEPYIIGFSTMSLPSGGFEGVVVVGSDRASLLGGAWNLVQGEPDSILQPRGIVVDECEGHKLEHPQLGDIREIGGFKARVVGLTHGIAGFSVTPYVFTTFDRAVRYLRIQRDTCSYILVKLAPGASRDRVMERIRQRIPDADTFPRETYGMMSINFWMTRTGLGISFGAATLLGLGVGLVMVAQTLYASVLDRLSEFGALKAMGAAEYQIFSILFAQAVSLAVVGAMCGLAIVSVVQRLVHTPRAPVAVPLWLSLGSCVMVMLICLMSSLLPYLRIRKVDPLMVLQA